MTDSSRKLDLEQLASVTGGTAAETEELKQAILGNPELAKIWQRKSDRYGFDDAQTCHMVLMEAFQVVNAECSDVNPNVYRVVADGEEKYQIGHADLVNFCKNYRAIN